MGCPQKQKDSLAVMLIIRAEPEKFFYTNPTQNGPFMLNKRKIFFVNVCFLH